MFGLINENGDMVDKFNNKHDAEERLSELINSYKIRPIRYSSPGYYKDKETDKRYVDMTG